MAQQAVDVILEGGGSLETAAEVVSVVTELDHFESAQSGGALAFSGRIGVNVTYRDEDGEVQSELVLIPFEGRSPEFDPELAAEVVEIREVHEFDAATRYFRQRVLVRVGAGEPIVPAPPPRPQPAPKQAPSAPASTEAELQEVEPEPPEAEVAAHHILIEPPQLEAEPPQTEAEPPAGEIEPHEDEAERPEVEDEATPALAEEPAQAQPAAQPQECAAQAESQLETPADEAEPPGERTIVWRPFPKSEIGEKRG